MRLVGYTYQDFLRYEMFLKLKEQKSKNRRCIKYSQEDLERLANLLIKIEDRFFSDEEAEDDGSKKAEENDAILKEDSEPYILNQDEKYGQIHEDILKNSAESRKKHDELFRDLINDKENFIDFMKYFVNPEFELTEQDIEKQNRNFVTTKYESRNSDIVFKEKKKDIYYLVEHQSSIDHSMPYRMLEYSYEILRDVIDKKKIKSKNYTYPIVVPIVLYTGNRKWKIPHVLDLISDKSYEDVGLSLKYMLIDINKYSKDELLNSGSMVGFAMQADRSNTKEELEEAIEKMLIAKPNKRKEVLNMIDFVFKNNLEDDEIKNIKELILKGKEVNEVMITVRERLAQNNKRIYNTGIEQGMAQGMAQRNKVIAKKMLSLGFSKEIIAKTTGLTKEEIEKL